MEKKKELRVKLQSKILLLDTKLRAGENVGASEPVTMPWPDWQAGFGI